ncbi:MAG: biotin/lipoyl-binding protein [Bacteroidetes bacterium]|nr:biotin/lipoyl-binding protein [Bacteroidota bacterium]MCL1968205.1 biotin/lipoyl-binding protein [Bacteroidota bacterium]
MKNYKFTINGNKYSVDIVDIEDHIATVEVNGTPYQVEMEMEIRKPVSAPKAVVKVATPSTSPTTPQATHKVADVPRAAPAPSVGSIIKSPLPGVVLDIFVKVGDSVKPGQHVLMLEAMKMENNIDADKEGVIKEIRVQRNDSVMEGDVLVVIG